MYKGYCFFLTLLLNGCISPIALDKATIAYDKSTTNILSKQLLLNIARAHQHKPIHFTGVSNIAATFNFQFNAGATPALTGENSSLITPIFGGSLSENPTITIIPIEGEEFTRRLLTPIQESKLTLLLRQGVDVDLILRLLASELHIHNKNDRKIYLNNPKSLLGYKFFRQAVLHLSSIQDRNSLYIEPLLFEKIWKVPVNSMSLDQLVNLQREFDVQYDQYYKIVTLKKRVIGHTVITNYDPELLTNDERERLHIEANSLPYNAIIVDIRPEFPCGELEIHGALHLRSFYSVLSFIGDGINDYKEFDVIKHHKTPNVTENPISTLGISVSSTELQNTDLSVNLDSLYYSIRPEIGYQWNREGFKLLYQLFQITMNQLSQENSPSISITK